MPMAWFIECPFCHKSVFRWFYSWHESGHTQRRPDGQMNEHITLAPEKRFEGSLEGVPHAYRHAKCGVSTGMPEEIIRTYLVNPLTYNDNSFCCGCGDYIHSSELAWIDTNESVLNYTAKLRCAYLKEEFGIDTADVEIIITPRAVRALEQAAAAQSLKQPFVVALSFSKQGPAIRYDLTLGDKWDTLIEVVVPTAGINVAVPKGLRSKLNGTVIDYNERSGGGLVIARFRGWD
jgi:hypothetical protein